MRHPIFLLLLSAVALASEAEFSRFGDGAGPMREEGILRLLDGVGSVGQANAVAFPRAQAGAFEIVTLRCKLRLLKGGDGGAIAFLSTREYGVRGPAPFVLGGVEPNLRGTFAIGIDVHNPPNEEPFGPWGNYQALPEREISLHWDGREIVKRVAPAEFRGEFAEWEVVVRHGIGGAEVSVRIGLEQVYDSYFIAGLVPYESRLAFGAATRGDLTTEFDVASIRFEASEPALARRPPIRFDLFNHVLTDNAKTAYETEVALPPAEWAFGRVILTLEIHDAGASWDEWDRCGEVSVWDGDGNKRGIVPFITSYRTPCHWQVDVTHFRPYLSGKTRFEVAAGTNFYKNRGYMMSASLEFHHGVPQVEAYRVVPLWVGTAHYGAAENHFQDFFTPQKVGIEKGTTGGRIFVTTTGHSQVGEFTPSKRTILFEPEAGADAVRFENTLWKSDCYLNPNRPQFGTWKYSRAGWAPGDVVRPWWIDLTPHLQGGKEALFRYVPEPYAFGDGTGSPSEQEMRAASHIVRGYLILYREPGAMVPAPILRVTGLGEGGSAAEGGILADDYLASYDGVPLLRVEDLRAAIDGALAAKKERVAVVIYRGGKRMELELATGRMGVNLAP